jgi:uncharacterized protein YegL
MRKALFSGSLVLVGLALAGHLACSAGGDSGFSPGSGGQGTGGGSSAGSGGTGIVLDATFNDSELTADTSCAATELQAEAVPLNLYFMLDRSASMTELYGSTMLIKSLRNGIAAFLNDPASAGIFATAQQFAIFIDGDPLNESCLASDYATPPMPWSACPYPQLGQWVMQLKADGLTPSVPALQGAVDACKARLAEVTAQKCAVIFVTDGKPQGMCITQDPKADLGNIAADAYNNAGIAVFAIGFPNLPADGKDVLNVIAANGGTGKPTVMTGSGGVDQEFVNALNAIRGTALACEYKMPELPAGKKPTFVVVRYTPGDGSGAQQLKRKLSKADCGAEGGWYYDNNEAPEKILLCPGSCAVVQPDAKGKVEVLVMCNEQPM